MISDDAKIIVTMRDIRKNGFCVDAQYFAEKHSINWREFARRGMPAADILKLATDADDRVDDVKRLIAAAEERVKNGRR